MSKASELSEYLTGFHKTRMDAAATLLIQQEALLRQALEALENSIDTVRNEYETDWRHGYPTREAQLAGMKEMLDQHEAAITAIKEALK